MNLYTDLVQSKRFSQPIGSELQKHSQEYRVVATLRYLFPQKYDAMTTNESPDLQDKKNGIGIEVTAAVQENDMKASRAFSELSQESYTKKLEKHIQKIKSCNYLPVTIQGNRISIVTCGISNEEKIFFQKSIIRKKSKFEKNRNKFKTLGLAIVLPEIPSTEAEDRCVNWIHEELQKDQYLIDFVYVLSHRFCIYYDVHKVYSAKWSISREDNRSLCTIARMTAEGELSLSDQEWQMSTIAI